jgi:hypothetical protein
MKSLASSKVSRIYASGTLAEDQDIYKKSWKKPEDKHPSVESVCFYKQLNITIKALMSEGWVTVDWLEDCGEEEIDQMLSRLKETNTRLCYRAINSTTGRMMDFA